MLTWVIVEHELAHINHDSIDMPCCIEKTLVLTNTVEYNCPNSQILTHQPPPLYSYIVLK
jgi:hypothetical protein